jgi:hypothetical protein
VNESVHEPHGDEKRRKYVFVGDLQRSGTSVLVRNVARLENCTDSKIRAYSRMRHNTSRMCTLRIARMGALAGTGSIRVRT